MAPEERQYEFQRGYNEAVRQLFRSNPKKAPELVNPFTENSPAWEGFESACQDMIGE